jgi:hypothetical protein
MLGQPRPASAAVYLLADHLDSVLAAGEDLLKLQLQTESSGERGIVVGPGVRGFVEAVRKLERVIAARALQARTRARDLAKGGEHFRALTSLFAAGLTPLQDALEDFADASGEDFDTADDPIAYLRSRGVIDGEAVGLGDTGDLAISERFLIVGRIALGPLLDLAATFLDVLELHYDLFVDEIPAAQAGALAPAVEASPGP